MQYEAPRVRVLGSFRELTQTGGHHLHWWWWPTRPPKGGSSGGSSRS